MNRRTIVLCCLALVVAIAAAFFAGRYSVLADKTSNRKKIMVVLPSSTNPFWLDVRRGAEEARSETPDYDVEVKVSTGDQDAKAQSNILTDLAVRGDVAAVVLGPASASEPIAALAHLDRKGVPSVVIDTTLDETMLKNFGFRPKAFIGSNNSEGAQKAARAINEELKRRAVHGPYRVLVIEGSRVHQSGIDRADGFYAEAKMLGFNVDTVRGEWNRARAQDLTAQKFLAGRYHAIFAGNDVMALGAITGLKSLKIQRNQWPIIIGFDYTEEAIKAIEAGDMFASVQQDPVGMGRAGVKLASQAADKDPQMPTEPTYLPIEVAPKSGN